MDHARESPNMVRRYDTHSYKKHKRPKGWGSLCPKHVTQAQAQALLESGVRVGNAVYNVHEEFCYRAFAHDEEGGIRFYHGHPIPWTRLPAAAKQALVNRGRLEPADYRKAVRKRLGAEFDG